MADSGQPPRRRLVPWNPEETGPDGSAPPPLPPDRQPRGRPPLKWIALGVAVLVLALLVWRVVAVLPEFLPERAEREVPAETPPEGEEGAAAEPPPTGERSDARTARDHARALRDAVRMEAAGSPREGALLEIERYFVRAERAEDRRAYAEAEAEYRRAVRELEALRGDVSAWRAAREGIAELEDNLREVQVEEAFEADALREVREGLSRARTSMEIGRYGEAANLAASATARLAEARQSAAGRLEAEVSRGQRALAEGDGATAIEAFDRVLALDPAHEAAAVGRQRAETIEEVSARMREGRRLEERGDLRGALAAYGAAADLDEYAVDARQAVSRVRRALRDKAVEDGFREVAQLIEADRWDEAERRLRDLRGEYPEDNRIAGRMEAFAEERRLNRVRVALIAAREAESAREWERARGIYRDLIDTGVDRSEVIEGYERTGRVLRAKQAFAINIRIAREAADRGDYQDAITRFNAAMEQKPDYVDLTTEQVALQSFLEQQSRPVPVTFISDGRTLVSYIGPMNRSPAVMEREQTVELLPGRYRIRGARMRFRPVEFELLVRGDEPPGPVRVIAHERER
ncbi:MAG: hypothetical protein JJU00_01515 [Opitutales bacterium]|nr:hypothetical protein [Opitutales bacterium]